MKKIYIAPASQSFEVQCNDNMLLTISLNDNGGGSGEGGSLSSDDFVEGGPFEYNSSRKGCWEKEGCWD